MTTLELGSVYPSITIGADGLALISYQTAGDIEFPTVGGGLLKVAHCANISCTTTTSSTLASDENVDFETSITIGADGLGLISYQAHPTEDLKVAHCENTFCAPYFRRR